jgi:hypothetical protein
MEICFTENSVNGNGFSARQLFRVEPHLTLLEINEGTQFTRLSKLLSGAQSVMTAHFPIVVFGNYVGTPDFRENY